MDRAPFSTHGFAVVVCRNFDGRWLAVKETKNRGWWLPAGLVDPGESFTQAAHRECQEEAGISIELKGLLRVEHSVYGPTHARIRVIFYAEPTDREQAPKRTADKASEEARWVTLDDLKRLAKGQPGLRGPELYEWGSFLEQGGAIAPITFLAREDQVIPAPPVALAAVVESIEKGDYEGLREALRSGVTVNAPINSKLWTPLHLACRLRQEECVQLLLLADADVAALTHKQRNVVHFCAQSTPAIASAVVSSLCLQPKWLAVINQRDALGDTPLHIVALSFGRGFIWELLMQYGADAGIRNHLGLSPEELADRKRV